MNTVPGRLGIPHLSQIAQTEMLQVILETSQSVHHSIQDREVADHQLAAADLAVVEKDLAVHLRVGAEDLVVVANKIWGEHDLLLADLDGVVYEGTVAIKNAVETLNVVSANGIPVGYVTNNSSRKPETIVQQLLDLGLQAKPEDIISSGQTAVELLQTKLSPGAKVLVVGGDGLRARVLSGGFEIVLSSDDNPAAVVQGFAPDVSWKDLAEASYSIQNGAIWVATNNDWTLPQEKGLAPGNGTLVGAVHTAVGQLPIVAGKPEPAIFQTALNLYKAQSPVFVGDRMDTDILGANRAGIKSVLVLTGVSTRKDVLAAKPEERPTYIIASLDELLEKYQEPKQTKRGWSCGKASVELLGDKVLVTEGNPQSIEALRAACMVIWNSGKHIHFLNVQSELYEKKA
jgi:HAD superfamily hydrolase (TIGR01450 family)